MSRIARLPVDIPKDVEVKIVANNISVKGSGGSLSYSIHNNVQVNIKENKVHIKWNEATKKASAQAGTVRASINNLIVGVSSGFSKNLSLVGVGYRAQTKGKVLVLSLGFSNPIEYKIPEGITIESTSQTELTVKGASKQQVGQVAAEIRAFRPPEPYKGKGVRYADEHVVKKSTKKK